MTRPSPLTSLRRALPGLAVFRRRHPDGSPFLSVANPHPGGLPIRIDLGDEPALCFGPHHDHYDPTPDGWRDLLADVSRLVAGPLVVCSVSDAADGWPWHSFVDTGEPWTAPASPHAEGRSLSPLRTDADAFRFLAASQWNPVVGELFARFARVGAVLDVLAWNPAQNRRFALAPDWFQTIVRPTGLDYLLAAAEVQSVPGGSLLESFSFDAGDATLEALRDGSRWLLRPAPWTCPPRHRQRRTLASAPSLPALLDAPLPLLTAGRQPAAPSAPASPSPSTVRSALAALPAWDISIVRARGDDDLPWTVETPLDPIGLCGLLDDWTRCPAHFLSATLRPDEAAALRPFVALLSDRLGAAVSLRASPEFLPSRCAAPALALLRSWLARHRPPAARDAASKLLPVFESAATLRMPISFRFD